MPGMEDRTQPRHSNHFCCAFFCAKILLFSFLARSWEGAVKNCILNIILSYNSRSDQIEQEQYCTTKNKIKHSIKDG